MLVPSRRRLSILALPALLTLAACAQTAAEAASAAAWNGRWDGTLANGAVVQVDIRNGEAAYYAFRGRSWPIASSSVSGKVMTIYLAGNIGAQIRLTSSGTDTAIFDYNSGGGGMASGNLMRRPAAP